MTGKTYKLEELARAAGTSARTIRYYVQRGLLPAPAFRGKDTSYDVGHLLRLRAIKRLQDAFFPLDAIAAELARLDDPALERLADGKDLPARGWAAPDAETSTPDASPSAVDAAPSRVLREVVLAEGVTLLVDEAAPAASRRLVATLLSHVPATKPRLHEGR